MSKQEIRDLADLMREEEDAALAKTKVEMAEEQRQWNALPQEERERILAEREAKFTAMADGEADVELELCEECGEEIDPFDDPGTGQCSSCHDQEVENEGDDDER